jgi:uncharacterized protein YhaN
MRLNRLDLTRYGKFTGKSISFGKKVASKTDLHLIYGLNEAGKSTLFSAYLDLLFGIGPQSPYNFIHSYAAMRIGAQLEFAGGPRDLLRVKRKESLLDAQERPISDAVLNQELGGIDREAYCMMFSLDDKSLERGGQSILASQGELGRLLFSASAGLSDLNIALQSIREHSEAFYKPRGRSHQLSGLKNRLADLKNERERLDTVVNDYRALVEERDRVQQQYSAAQKERAAQVARRDEIQRQLTAFPKLGVLRETRHRLDDLSGIPEPPATWAEELDTLRKQDLQAQVKEEAISNEIGRLKIVIGGLEIDPRCERMAAEVDRLKELRARYMGAEKDLPGRRISLREADAKINGILKRIEREEERTPARLILGASVTGALQRLMEQWSGIDQAFQSAEVELSTARTSLEAELFKLGEEDSERVEENDLEMSKLEIVVESVRSSDHAVRERTARRTSETAKVRLESRLKMLLPWSGQVEALEMMVSPDRGKIARWKTALNKSELDLTGYIRDVEEYSREVERSKAKVNAISGATGVVSDKEAATVRGKRERAWAQHRNDLDAASADSFEEILRQDDIVTAARISHVGELAKLHQAQQSLAEAQAALKRANVLKIEGGEARDSILKEIAVAISRMNPSLSKSNMTLSGFEEWLAKREKAIESQQEVEAAEQDVRTAVEDGKEAALKLFIALKVAGVQHDLKEGFDALLAIGRETLDQHAKRRMIQNTVEELRNQFANRSRTLQEAEARQKSWLASWSKLCSQTWLSESGAQTIETVREILINISELPIVLQSKSGLEDRIAKMERDQMEFREHCEMLAQVFCISAETGSLLERAELISTRMKGIESDRQRKTQAEENLENKENEKRAAAEVRGLINQNKNAMLGFFGVQSLDDVAVKLADVKTRRELNQQKDQIETEIVEALRVEDLAIAESTLERMDRSTLELELVELDAKIEDQVFLCQQLFSSVKEAGAKLDAVGGDSKIADLEEQRQTALLEIREGSIGYLRLSAGVLAAEQALQIYRDKHRSSMMERASAAFRTISRGDYSGLTSQPDRDREILMALPAAGGSKGTDELSRATRYQLYLALRVAGYHEFARSRSTLPFIADDIMESFDNFRAEEAFRLLAEMGDAGQVIYLTHHKHLCEIAERVCPSVQIYDLESPISQTR